MAKRTETFVDNFQTFNVNCFVADHIPVVGQPQKKGRSSIIIKQRKKLKYVKGASCVDQLSSVQHVTNVHTIAQNPLVGARLLGPPEG